MGGNKEVLDYITVFARNHRLTHIETLAETFKIRQCWEIVFGAKPR